MIESNKGNYEQFTLCKNLKLGSFLNLQNIQEEGDAFRISIKILNSEPGCDRYFQKFSMGKNVHFCRL